MENIKKKILAISMIFMLCLFNIDVSYGIITPDQKIGSKPEIFAWSAVLMDAKSGEVLMEKNGDDIREQASTTKIMTALLAVEKLSLDTVVTIDEGTAKVEGSSIYLQAGEEITVRELLYGLMLRSGNDAAVALAKAVGGTEENFANMMNEKAKELGLENTNFKNPHGLPADGHYTSAYDLAKLSKVAMKNDILRSYAATIKHTIPPSNMNEERKLITGNRLMFDEEKEIEINGKKRHLMYDGINGLKTGYTKEAGHCIVASAQRGENHYIVAILGSNKANIYKDAIKLLDWGFENYSSLYIMSGSEGEKIPVKKGKNEKTKAVLREDVYVSIPMGADKKQVTHSIKALDDLTAPIEEGEHIADLEICYGNKIWDKIPLYAAEENEKGGFISFLRNLFILQIITILAGIALIAVLLKFYSVRKRRIELQKEEERKRKALELQMERLAENRKKFMNYR